MSVYRYRIISSKWLFIVSVIVALVIILAVWLLGLGQHHSLFHNSVLSTSLLSIAFFLFISIGLYRGWKLKDELGKITDKISLSTFKPQLFKKKEASRTSSDSYDWFHLLELFDESILVFIAWLVIAAVFVLLILILSGVLWSLILVFAAMLYWIFFRALRMVFKQSGACRGNLNGSLTYALVYTLLYNFWIYAIIFISHYMSGVGT
ncbi:MAG: hypothetical protein IT236_10935 [Bacteroidia bacterium]|nr:hypothetical protein [Bacteroidia bacterium]